MIEYLSDRFLRTLNELKHLDGPRLNDFKKLSEAIETIKDAHSFWKYVYENQNAFASDIENSNTLDFIEAVPWTISMLEDKGNLDSYEGTDLGKICWYIFYSLLLE